jgi:isocitrate lyase
MQRLPTKYERDGMRWWNSMSERQRAHWLERVNMESSAAAYDEYLRVIVADTSEGVGGSASSFTTGE